MTYERAVAQMKKLERYGYINPTYSDYSGDGNVYIRTFNDMDSETKQYLLKKIKERLDDEEVVYSLGYSIMIIPHKRIKEAIENAQTYEEMVRRLNRVRFVDARNDNGEKVQITLTAQGTDGSYNFTHFMVNGLASMFDKSNIKFVVDDNGSYGKTVYIISEECMKFENNKEEIDKLFL